MTNRTVCFVEPSVNLPHANRVIAFPESEGTSYRPSNLQSFQPFWMSSNCQIFERISVDRKVMYVDVIVCNEQEVIFARKLLELEQQY